MLLHSLSGTGRDYYQVNAKRSMPCWLADRTVVSFTALATTVIITAYSHCLAVIEIALNANNI